MQKTVYSFSPVSFMYLGPVVLGEGDLSPREPGVWLIPAHCLEVAPPDIPQGKYAAVSNGEWKLFDIPRAEPVPEVAPIGPEAAKPVPLPDVPVVVPEAKPLTQAQRIALLRDVGQSALDDLARVFGFDDMRSAVTYADEPAVPRFQEPARALRAYRSIFWEASYALLDEVLAGTKPEPTAAEYVELMPRFGAQAEPASKPAADSTVQPEADESAGVTAASAAAAGKP